MSPENSTPKSITELWKLSDIQRQEILNNPLAHPFEFINILMSEGFSPEQAIEQFKNLFKKNKNY